MKYFLIGLTLIGLFFLSACGGQPKQNSDTIQRNQQEQLLREGTQQTGLPAIKNFRERKLLKDILELRDQEGLVTFSYVENLSPVVVPGKTALGGKFTFLGQSVGYSIPYATQYTNPAKIEAQGSNYGYAILPQADPNGLFSPASAEGTWIILKKPGSNETGVVYMEPRIAVFPYQLPLD